MKPRNPSQLMSPKRRREREKAEPVGPQVRERARVCLTLPDVVPTDGMFDADGRLLPGAREYKFGQSLFSVSGHLIGDPEIVRARLIGWLEARGWTEDWDQADRSRKQKSGVTGSVWCSRCHRQPATRKGTTYGWCAECRAARASELARETGAAE